MKVLIITSGNKKIISPFVKAQAQSLESMGVSDIVTCETVELAAVSAKQYCLSNDDTLLLIFGSFRTVELAQRYLVAN
mgnify:CR=1 FL=1